MSQLEFPNSKTGESKRSSLLTNMSTFFLGFTLLFTTFPLIITFISLAIAVRKVFEKFALMIYPDYIKLVDSTSNIFASDLLSDKPPRCSIVSSILVRGNITKPEIYQLFERFFTLKKENGSLVYPEDQQFIETWNGYTFWRQDLNFSLDNHLVFHPPLTKKGVTSLREQLLNQGFTVGQSPWDVHIVRRYVDPDFQGEECMTLIILRFHHLLADGYSILYAMADLFLPNSTGDLKLPKATFRIDTGRSSIHKLLFQLFVDVGNIFMSCFRSSKWKVGDAQKNWKQIYRGTDLISTENVKAIKNKLNVEFVSVLLAAASAALSRLYKAKYLSFNSLRENEMGSLFLILPVPNHPRALVNHCTGTYINIALKDSWDPVQRVIDFEKLVQKQKASTNPLIILCLWRALGLLPYKLSGWIFAYLSRSCSMIMTCLPAGENDLFLTGDSERKLLNFEAGTGALTGVVGIMLTAISYKQHLRFAVTAEESVLTSDDIKALSASINDEIDVLCNSLLI